MDEAATTGCPAVPAPCPALSGRVRAGHGDARPRMVPNWPAGVGPGLSAVRPVPAVVILGQPNGRA